MTTLEQLQKDLVGMYLCNEQFANVPVFEIRTAEVQSKIDAALAGTSKKNNTAGLAVSVYMPELINDQPDSAGPLPSIRVTVAVEEIPIINNGSFGTGTSAEDLAVYILRLRHQWKDSSQTWELTPDREALTAEVVAASVGAQQTTMLRYLLKFNAEVTLTAPARVATPSATVTSTVTLACGTSGASIYWTTDNSFPRAGNGNLYTAPFTTPVGVTLRVCAHKSGLAASAVLSEICP